MTDDAVSGVWRSAAMAFRPELADFGGFYERTYQVAFRTALGIVRDPSLAAEVTQDAYVAAYRHRDRFRGDVPADAWLHRIVVNDALKALRRERPIVREVEPAEPASPDASRRTAERLALFDALDVLAPRQRAAVILRYYHDYDYATIARMLETTSTNVGAMLNRALGRLRRELEPEERLAAEAMGR
jgi:RNA polymerase sigma-70 factor (ECF subfamily)